MPSLATVPLVQVTPARVLVSAGLVKRAVAERAGAAVRRQAASRRRFFFMMMQLYLILNLAHARGYCKKDLLLRGGKSYMCPKDCITG